MHNPKPIRQWLPSNGDGEYLRLDYTDSQGQEFIDGSIVKIKDKQMIGVIRYSWGRFEILCTFKDQRFVYGLNPDHTIIGHVAESDVELKEQAERKYNG